MTKAILFAKLDPGFYENPKVVDAGRDGREVYQLALCINATRGFRGVIPTHELEPRHVARRLRLSEEEARTGIARALTAELLAADNGEIRIVGWDSEWGRASAKSDAERAKAYRERKKSGVTDERDGANGHENASREPQQDNPAGIHTDPSDASRASRGRHASRNQREEKEERAQRDGSLSGVDHPMPGDWQPNSEHRRIADELGVDVESEAADLRLHAASLGWERRSWDAQFTRWMRQSKNKGARKAQRQTAAVRALSFDSLGNVIELEHEPDGSAR